MGSSRVHTAYSWISLACRNLFMIWASLRKSSESMVPIRGGPSETGRSECLKQQQIELVIMIKFCFPASNAAELLLCFKCGKTKVRHRRTRFKGLHRYWRGFIPQTLEHFSKLTSPQLPQQLDGFTVNLPLVHGVVWQAVSLRDLHLQQQRRGTLTLRRHRTRCWTARSAGQNYSAYLLAWFP